MLEVSDEVKKKNKGIFYFLSEPNAEKCFLKHFQEGNHTNIGKQTIFLKNVLLQTYINVYFSK